MIELTREEAQQVLNALKHLCLHTAAIKGYDGHKVQPPINMLKAKLKQPENEFNPDWDAMAVMVEEQQRMAKRIEELTQREWQGLTDEEIESIYAASRDVNYEYERAIEARLKEKNNG